MAEPSQQITVIGLQEAEPASDHPSNDCDPVNYWRLCFKLSQSPDSAWARIFNNLALKTNATKNIDFGIQEAPDVVVTHCFKDKVPAALKRIRETAKKANIKYVEHLKSENALKVEIEKQVEEWKKDLEFDK
jgi:hypothetical protein